MRQQIQEIKCRILHGSIRVVRCLVFSLIGFVFTVVATYGQSAQAGGAHGCKLTADEKTRAEDSSRAVQPDLSGPEIARITAEAIRVQDVQLSPDGKWVTYSVSRPSVKANTYDLTLYLLATSGGSPPVTIAHGAQERPPLLDVFSPRWCPSGRCFSYFGVQSQATKKKGAPDLSLMRYEVSSKITSPIEVRDTVQDTHRPRITSVSRDYAWSPRGNYIAFTAPVEGERLDPRRGVELSAAAHGHPSVRVGLFVLEVASGKLTQVTPNSLNVPNVFPAVVHGFSWAPNDQELVVAVTPDADGVPYVRTDLVVVGRDGRTIRQLVTRPGMDGSPLWSPDGHSIAFFTHDGEATYYGGWPAVVSVAGTSVTAFPRTAPTHAMFGAAWWMPDGKSFFYIASEDMAQQLMVANPSKGSAEVIPDLTVGLAYDDDQSVSSDGRLMAYTRSSVASPPELFIRALDGKGNFDGAPRQLTHLSTNYPLSKAVHVETLSWPSSDGKFTIHGLLVTPTSAWQNDCVARPLPTLVYLQGGPQMVRRAFADDGFGGGEVAMAARGYAVLVPNTRGRGGYGMGFQRGMRDGHSAGRLGFEDAMAGVDLLIQRGVANPNRLGVYGHSYGGYLTSYAITQTQRFKAAVDYEGIAPEWFSLAMVANPGTDWALLARDLYGIVDPYDPAERTRLIAESPGLNMDHVTTPTLLLFGAESLADKAGAPLEALLQRFKIPSEFLVYDEGHGFSRPAAVADGLIQTEAWMDKWVLASHDSNSKVP